MRERERERERKREKKREKDNDNDNDNDNEGITVNSILFILFDFALFKSFLSLLLFFTLF